jgi:hypothetical protein
LCCVSSEGVPSPQGRDIDGKYLDANEAELKDLFQKWRNEWHEHGVSIMCDSWTGPTRMSVINFLLYQMVDCGSIHQLMRPEKSQDAKFILKVTI